MLDCEPVATPLPAKSQLYEGAPLLKDITSYRALIGSLQYLKFTRPDLAFAFNLVCQFMHSPTEFTCLLQNIFSDISKQLLIKVYLSLHCQTLIYLLILMQTGQVVSQHEDQHLVIAYFLDLIWFHGVLKSKWQSLNQVQRLKTGAMSSTAAELTWISFILCIRVLHTPVLLCDNLSALHLSVNPVFNSRSKHFEIYYHYVRQRVALKLLQTQNISTKEQLADIFTKSLLTQPFQTIVCTLNLCSIAQLEGG